MKRTRLSLAVMIAASTLATVSGATTAEAAGPTAVYSSVSPSRPMASERFAVVWNLSTSFKREARLQTISSGSWKTISTIEADDDARFFGVHSTRTREYRVYVPRALYNGKSYPSYASPAKTLRVFAQTANAFATPNEQCGTVDENVPVTMVAQFEPRRPGRTVTFTSVSDQHPTVTAKTDTVGNVAVQLPDPTGTNADFQTAVTAASFNGSVPKTVIISYRNVENHCSWFK